MNSKKIIAIIYGGDSSEIVVSRKSAEGIQSFIDTDKYDIVSVCMEGKSWNAIIDNNEYCIDKNDFSYTINNIKYCIDFAYITIHGTPGEDGKLQGYFELLDIPYSSCGVLASSLTFNKFACNNYLKGFGLKVADSLMIRKGINYDANAIVEKLGLPCFVKPNAGGSSFGITKVKKAEEMEEALKNAFSESDEVIIEQFIKGLEVTCGLYKTHNNTSIFPLTEVIPANEFFDFEAKYNADKVQEITPARVPEETTNRIQQISSMIYDILACKGIVRVDYIISENQIYLLEVNTTPGMTKTSFIPQQIAAAKLDIKDVFTEIIESNIA
ncbi:D-alanine--D-alanine ligase [Saccharicrinis aurantiacus]|uniref:D-alanine--D-alanine ligase n=1 Tax=Saccharicrinis aurantiacus TaxID=1849719 RepID=UPI0024912D8A|nr:D-alanine--D-alanine ligase [Saccharicrinis aurantiacus]